MKREIDAEKGWCARNTKGQHWIQVDLGKILMITKVGTGGLKGKGGNAKTFSVLYSNNGQSWEAAKEGGEKEVSSSPCFDLKLRCDSLNVRDNTLVGACILRFSKLLHTEDWDQRELLHAGDWDQRVLPR